MFRSWSFHTNMCSWKYTISQVLMWSFSGIVRKLNMLITWKPMKLSSFSEGEHWLPFLYLLPEFQCLLYNRTFGLTLHSLPKLPVSGKADTSLIGGLAGILAITEAGHLLWQIRKLRLGIIMWAAQSWISGPWHTRMRTRVLSIILSFHSGLNQDS